MTDFLIGTAYEGYASSMLYSPILSRESTCTASEDDDGYATDCVNGTVAKVLGFSSIGFNWEKELSTLSHDILGVDCVLRSVGQGQAHTYYMHNGRIKYRGGDDFHNRNFDDMRVDVPLSLNGSFAHMSACFVLDIYPTNTYKDSFQSNTPIYTSVGLVFMIIFTSVVFYLYDFFVSQDARQMARVLKMKRDFVRFISHEIRTPLNTVAVGVTLLEEALLAMQQQETTKTAEANSVRSASSVRMSSKLGNGETDHDMSVPDMLNLTSDVQNSTTVAVAVLNDLLNFDKLEAGEVHLEKEQVNILELVSSVVQSFRIQAYQKQINLSLEFEGLNPSVMANRITVLGDKFKLSHVIRNLMSNALKFTERDLSITVIVSLTYREENDSSGGEQETQTSRSSAISYFNCCRHSLERSKSASYNDEESQVEMPCSNSDAASVTFNTIQVAVKDTGYGLTKEQLSLLFQDGMQFDPNKLQAGQGSGLGLHLSHKIVELHGGRMWADSEGPNKGSTFFMSLPLDTIIRAASIERQSHTAVSWSTQKSREEVHDYVCSSLSRVHEDSAMLMNRENSQNNPSPRRISHPPGLVLVVDDTASNRKIVCRLLKSRGFKCVEAKDGQECIKIVQDKASKVGMANCDYFCCILMDFEMPILNGPDTTKALRDLGYCMPIFGLTGNVMQDDIQYFLSSGADHVLAKPLQVIEFMDMYNGLSKIQY